MFEGVIIKKISTNVDYRGWLAEIYRQDEVVYSPAMAYVSLTKPGVTRGPHEHKFQTDGFVFVGPGDFVLHLWDRREGSSTQGEHFEIEVGEKNPIFVIVPPGVVHGYKCISQNDGWSLNLPDKLYRGKNKAEEVDEIRWEDDKEQKYQII